MSSMPTSSRVSAVACIIAISLLAVAAIGQTGAKAKDTPEKKLQGYWKSTEAIVQFKPGSRITINNEEYDYAIVGSTIIVSNDEGEMEFPYKLVGDVLTVVAEGRRVVYNRMTADEVAELKVGRSGGGRVLAQDNGSWGGGGGNPQDLVGKWCYSANVNAQGGGRQSDICFTLKSDGTYEYYGEASSSNPNGGAASQSWDYGRWSATATTLTARSNSGETKTYTLERRNHPKTGDPMLMVDGDAFVTFYQKRPW